MTYLPAPAQALLGTDAVAHLWTTDEHGAGHVAVLWVLVRDDQLLFATRSSSAQACHIRHRPSVLVSIEDVERSPRGFQRHLVIRGTAQVVPGSAADLLRQLARKYLGTSTHPVLRTDDPSVCIISVGVESIEGRGPWAESSVLVASDDR